MKTTVLFILSAACMLSLLGAANAQDSTYAVSKQLPGISEATVYTGAPSGFDPVNASDEELLTYGYPRRPDPSDGKAYSMWQRAINTTRVNAELVLNPGRFHRPNQKIATLSTVENTTNVSSGNWSGYSLVNGTPKFDEVAAVWVVPNVNSQFEKLTGYSSMWVGIDGNCSCNDLIQDGTEQEWHNGTSIYYAWVEFIPNPEVKISGFTVQPGDVISAYSTVEVKSGKTYGYYYLANLNTKKSVSTSLLMPKGITYSGKSAEWVVERTEVGGSFQNPMPNYAYAYMDNAFAYRAGSSKSISYLSEANEHITMVDSTGKKLSTAYEQDGDSMWFEWLAY